MKSGELTIEEMLEVVLHFAVYCGWPKASNLEMYVRQTWARVQEERGEDPKPLPTLTDNDELGSNDWDARIARGARGVPRREPRSGARPRTRRTSMPGS